MTNKRERENFSERLRQVLQEAGLRGDSPTILQRHLSLQGIDITVHAARKWLMGEAIPTQDKLTRIAQWLGKAPDWLRYGTGDGVTTAPAVELIEPRTLRMLHGFEQLVERDQLLVQVMIDRMLQSTTTKEQRQASIAADRPGRGES